MNSELYTIVVHECTNKLLDSNLWVSGAPVYRHKSNYGGETFSIAGLADIEVYVNREVAEKVIETCEKRFVGVTFEILTYDVRSS